MAFTDYTQAASKLRDYLRDKAEFNILTDKVENSDQDLVDAIVDALIEINNFGGNRTYFSLSDVQTLPEESQRVPWSLVKRGAVLQLLLSNQLLSARISVNNVQDAGGIAFADFDTWGRYLNIMNSFISRYTQDLANFKIKENISGAFGGIASPMSLDQYWGNSNI